MGEALRGGAAGHLEAIQRGIQVSPERSRVRPAEHALAAFKKSVSPGQRIYALDGQHECWSFDPHARSDFWHVPVFPKGDYYLFLEPQLKWAWLGRPWELSFRIFGEPLLSAVLADPPKIFRELIRKT